MMKILSIMTPQQYRFLDLKNIWNHWIFFFKYLCDGFFRPTLKNSANKLNFNFFLQQ